MCCVQFDDDHSKDIEALWSTLVSYWPGNLNVIIRYLIVMTGLAPQSILPTVSIMILSVNMTPPPYAKYCNFIFRSYPL